MQVTQLLLAAGASGGEANRAGMQPLDMGANQGSWREVHTMLTAQPELLTKLGPRKGKKLPAVDGYSPGGCLLGADGAWRCCVTCCWLWAP
jgi:hypothetical protein